MPEYQTITLVKQDRVATITLNRPRAANGLSLQLTTELAQAAHDCANDSDLKAVILTAAGRFFCAGGDINEMQASADGPGKGVKRIADALHEALSVFARMDIPLISAVNGTAAGAGFSIAVSADLVIAAESAKFTMAYSKVGLSPDGSASYYLPRLIGIRKTQELMFTNRVLSSLEAYEWGLVTAVVADDELQSAAQKLAQSLVNGSKGSNAAIKTLLSESYKNDLETQMNLESVTIAKNADSEDGKEGIAAFLEKRRPEFS
jgi:2-(1,2-epoxy-1,2-dihydrophenyl)acetyl-CoA isomerase